MQLREGHTSCLQLISDIQLCISSCHSVQGPDSVSMLIFLILVMHRYSANEYDSVSTVERIAAAFRMMGFLDLFCISFSRYTCLELQCVRAVAYWQSGDFQLFVVDGRQSRLCWLVSILVVCQCGKSRCQCRF